MIKKIIKIGLVLLLLAGCSPETTDFKADKDYMKDYKQIEKNIEGTDDYEGLLTDADALIENNPEIAAGYLLKAEIYKKMEFATVEEKEAYIDITIDEALKYELTEKQIEKLLEYYGDRRNRYMEVINAAKEQNISIDKYQSKIDEIETYYNENNGENFNKMTDYSKLSFPVLKTEQIIDKCIFGEDTFNNNINEEYTYNINGKYIMVNDLIDELGSKDLGFADYSQLLIITNQDFSEIHTYPKDDYKSFISGNWYYFLREEVNNRHNFVMVNRVNLNDYTTERKYINVKYDLWYLGDFYEFDGYIAISGSCSVDEPNQDIYYIKKDLQKVEKDNINNYILEGIYWDYNIHYQDIYYLDNYGSGVSKSIYYDENMNQILSFDENKYHSIKNYGSSSFAKGVFYEGDIYFMQVFVGLHPSYTDLLLGKLFRINTEGEIVELTGMPRLNANDINPEYIDYGLQISFLDGKPVLYSVKNSDNVSIYNIEKDRVVRNKDLEEKAQLINDLTQGEEYSYNTIYFSDSNNYSYLTKDYIIEIKDGVKKEYYIREKY